MVTPHNDKVNLFVGEVILAFKPELFDLSLKQRDGVGNLQVNNVRYSAMRTKLGSSSTSMNANESAISQGSKCGLSNTCCVKIMLNTLNKAGTPLDELQLLYCTQLAIKTNQLTLDSQKELFRSIQLSKKEPDQTYPSFLYALSISVREQYSLNGFRYWLRPCFLFHVTLELKSIFLLLH